MRVSIQVPIYIEIKHVENVKYLGCNGTIEDNIN